MKIIVGAFALARHFDKSKPYSQCLISPAQLAKLVEENIEKAKPGFRPGVLLVPVPAVSDEKTNDWSSSMFLSGVVPVDPGMRLVATYGARREGEAPFVSVYALSTKEKVAAKKVTIILYSREALAEDNSNTDITADYEVVSINAQVTEEDEPPAPMAMARNFLGLAGGTKTEYSAQQFAESIIYWSNKVMVAP